MATDFQKFRQKMDQAKQKSKSSSQYNWAKLDAGKRYSFRFLPLKSEGLDLPISVFHHHAITFPDGHFESIACPKRAGTGECPFCAYATQLYRKFTRTENIKYKDAFKKIVAKTHYLLVGYNIKELDPTNITSEDLKIVRASSKANMELIETKLEKEIDFVDFTVGRTVDLVKTKSTGKDAVTTVVWDFGDAEPAFSGKNGAKIWNELVDKSPDLTPIVTPLEPAALEAKFKEFMESPIVSDDFSEDEPDRELLDTSSRHATVDKVSTVDASDSSASSDFSLEDMRKAIEED